MALTPYLVDTYLRYKSGTQKFVQWLAETASKIKPVDDLIIEHRDEGKPSAGRLKGKARTQSKQQAPTITQVPLKSFQSLTEIIAAANVTIPGYVLAILRDVIDSRKECAVFYKAQELENEEVMKQHNDGHQFFIEALNQVYNILKLLYAKSSNPGHVNIKNSNGANIKVPGNIFEHLDLEDCDETPTISSSGPVKTTPKKTGKVYRLEHAAVHTPNMREYRHRRIPLTVAATTMNSAIEVLRRLNETFLIDFKDFDDHCKIIEFLHAGYYAENETKYTTGKGSSGLYNVGGIALTPHAFVCEPTTKIYFQTWILPRQTESTWGAVVRMDENNDTNQDRRNAQGEMHVMLRLFSLIGLQCSDVNWSQPGDFRSDNLMFAAYRATIKSRKAPTWAVFAFQMYIDIHRELDDEVERPFHEMRATGSSILRTFQALRDHGLTSNPRNFYDEAYDNTILHVETMTRIDYSTERIIHLFLKKPEFVKKAIAWGPNFLLRNDPLQCGLFMQRCLRYFHDIGIEQELYGAITATIHIYNMALHNTLLPQTSIWADLEYLIKQCGSYLFVGTRPRTLRECWVRIMLASGISASDLAKTGTAGARVVKRTKEPRGLPYISVYAHQLRGKHITPRQYDNKSVRHAYDRRGVMFERMAASHLERTSNERNVRASHHKRPAMSHLDMLSAFKKTMEDDAFACQFDVISLSLRCVGLLRRAQEVLRCPIDDRSYYTLAFMLLTDSDLQAHFREPEKEIWSTMYHLIQTEGNQMYQQTVGNVRVVKGPLKPDERDGDQATHEILNRITTSEAMDAWMNRKFGREYGNGGWEYRMEGTKKKFLIDADAGVVRHHSGLTENLCTSSNDGSSRMNPALEDFCLGKTLRN